MSDPSKERDVSTRVREIPWRAWVVLGIALVATAVVWFISAEHERRESQLRFETLASRINTRIGARMRFYEQVLRSGTALFDTWGDVSLRQWRSYVGHLQLDVVLPGIQGIGFAELVTPEERAEHVARIRAQGFPEYEITPPGIRAEYAAIAYLEPLDWRNRRAIGFDMMSNPVRRAAMQRARSTGTAALSGKVLLVQETEEDQQAGFLLYLPVYEDGIVPDTREGRRDRLRGFVYAPFRAGDFMTAVLGGESREVRLQLFDGQEPNPDRLLYDSLAGGAGEPPVPVLGLVREQVLPMQERRWSTRISLLPSARADFESPLPPIVALSGTVISFLLFLITWSGIRTNERLRRNQAELHYLFMKNPSVMWVYDRETLRFLEVNEAAIALYGYSRDEFLSMKLTDIRPGADVEQFSQFLRSLPEGLRHAGEWTHCTKDGRTLIVDITSHTLRYGGRNAVLVVARDVTDRKQAQAALAESEERFRSMADSMPALLYVGDRIGDVAFVNRSWTEFTGRPAEAELGRGWLDRVHPDDREWVGNFALPADSPSQTYTLEYRLRRSDGTYRWFVDRGKPRFDASGELIGYIGVLFDITEHRAAEEQLQQVQKMESIGRLTGGIAHDFNNLLTVIGGSAELMAESPMATPQQRKLAATVVAAAERGAELTRSMLAFARRQPLQPKLVDVGEIVSAMEPMLHRVLGEDVDLRFRKSDRLWLALADAGQIETAILNLAVNSRDAMPEGGMLTIETANATLDQEYAAAYPDLRPGDYVMVAVSDTGTGMPPEVLEHVFEPFFTTKPVGQGTGLGLSMVFGFVKQSGGHIKAYSEVGHGTTIRIYLPRGFGIDAEEPGGSGPGEIAPSGTESILLVEDDQLVRAHVEGQLRGLGYEVTAVAEGRSALAMLEQPERGFDLLFTDVIMPGGMNGRDLAEQARRLRPGLKVLFMSGYAENALTHHGRVAPGVHLLNKPFRRSELAAKLREVMDA